MDCITNLEVRFIVNDDGSANRIATALEAMGYRAIRIDDTGEDHEERAAKARIAKAIGLVAEEYELSFREREVLWHWIGCGKSVSEISHIMGTSSPMIDNWQFSILVKLGCDIEASERPSIKRAFACEIVQRWAAEL